MSLTIARGPLASRPHDLVNYRIDGPGHLLFFEPFPRRVRGYLAGELVFDTRDGMLLHESNLLPQLYVPQADLRATLTPTAHTTHCPFKGDAAYWSVPTAGRTAENAVWAYPEPMQAAGWLRGYVAVYWSALDAWYDEDEEVFGHLRDPYHRVDIRPASRHIRVTVGGEVLAESSRPMVLSETGLPNRYYLPPDDVRTGALRESPTRTVCPYKGTASYRSTGEVDDVAWVYPEPLDGARAIAGHYCFAGDGVDLRVDGERVG
ncbi:MAG: DUF427 domain-containing protein [Streptosporangiales bacterium]